MFIFRLIRVDTVICYDPWGHYEENPDHYVTARCVEAACWMAGSRLDLAEHFEAGLKPTRSSRNITSRAARTFSPAPWARSSAGAAVSAAVRPSFTDGTKGELDFQERVVGRGGVFGPLEDVRFFQQVKVDPEAGTIVWPNEVDFCPDVLYSLVTGKPVRSLEPV